MMMLMNKPKREKIAAIVADSDANSDDDSDNASVKSYGAEAATAMDMQGRLRTALDVDAPRHGLRHLEFVTIPRVRRFGRFSRPDDEDNFPAVSLERSQTTFVKAPRINPELMMSHSWDDTFASVSPIEAPFKESYKDDEDDTASLLSIESSLRPCESRKKRWFSLRGGKNNEGESFGVEIHENIVLQTEEPEKDSCEVTEEGSTQADGQDSLSCEAQEVVGDPIADTEDVDVLNTTTDSIEVNIEEESVYESTKKSRKSLKSKLKKRWMKFRRGRATSRDADALISVNSEKHDMDSFEPTLNRPLDPEQEREDDEVTDEMFNEPIGTNCRDIDEAMEDQIDTHTMEVVERDDREDVPTEAWPIEESMEVVFFNGQTTRGLAM